jgi:TM2 domain-containing membrane protein YozV
MTTYVYAINPKSTGVTYLLWFFFGVLGIHHFYMGKTGRGILWLLTGGLFLVGLVIDLFTIPAQVRQVNAQRAVGIR